MATIVELCVENVKRIKVVMLKALKSGLVIIGGRNAQGKSSLMDAIAMTIGGGKLCPKEPIRRGAKKAKITMTLDDMVIERSFTAKGSYLKVTNKDGFVSGKPQELLDKLTGRISFDPLSFVNMDAKKQAATLRGLVGLDFTTLDAERKTVYDNRRDVSRDLKAQEAVCDSFVDVPDDTPDEPVSVGALMAELANVQAHNAEVDDAVNCEKDAEQGVQMFQEALAQLEEEQKHLITQIANRNAERAAAVAVHEAAKTTLENMEPMDETPIREAISNSQAININVSTKKQKAQYKAIRDGLAKKVANATNRIINIDADKEEQLASAQFPIGGLAFTADGVTYNDLPFEQASQAEQFRISIAMGLAMNPELKVMLIRDGSLLDDSNMKLIADMATEADAQVWIERVGENDKVAVIIEDGEVK